MRDKKSSLGARPIRGTNLIVAVTMILLGSLLIFSRLGHYSLWDDEAMDALSARGITNTGDVSALLGENIVAYRNGLLLVNLRHQGMPPLPAYAVAASFTLFGESAWAARLPFALSGLAFLTLVAWWSLRQRISLTAQLLLALAVLGNVSLLLYFRNCHYYGFGIFFITALSYLYLYHLQSRLGQLSMAFLAGLLMTSNPSWFVTFSFCLFVDYLIWHRKKHTLSSKDLAYLFLPQVAFGLLMVWRFNPLGTNLGGYLAKNTIFDRLTLFWWNWRDLNVCEFIPVTILVIAVIGLPFWKNNWIPRTLIALFLFVCCVTILSTQILSDTSVADVRYMAGAIPLCIALSVMVILELTRNSTWLAIPVGLTVFGTNVFNGGPFLESGVRSTIFSFAGELLNPPPEPYTAATRWIKENVKNGQSIWVLPEYMAYPLLFHAPDPIYAWQLAPNNIQPQFARLKSIHFQGRQPPDFIIVFGPMIHHVQPLIESWKNHNVRYAQTALLDVFWKDLYRPELFWRTFKPISGYDKKSQAIYIFQRTTPPLGTQF
jgi:hypothetical protein